MDIEALKAPLDRKHVATRKQGGADVSYIEGWHAIAEANRIFGFDCWNRETVEIKCVSERERQIGKGNYARDGWGVTYTAKVRVTVPGPPGQWIIVREGVGAGSGIDADCGLAHESAIKEAETDAMKRALMTFGNPFGLALYDKTQANVATCAPEPKPAAPNADEFFKRPSLEIEPPSKDGNFKTWTAWIGAMDWAIDHASYMPDLDRLNTHNAYTLKALAEASDKGREESLRLVNKIAHRVFELKPKEKDAA